MNTNNDGKEMMTYHPRRPYDDNHPDGYLESDRDYLENNRELAIALLDKYGTLQDTQ